jgi:hypothetical protein
MPGSRGGRQRGPWRLEIEAPTAVHAGQPITFRLRVTNLGRQPRDLLLGGWPAHDFRVLSEAGREVWRWSRGQVRRDVLALRTLQPGEEITFEGEWDQRDAAGATVPPGAYQVEAVLAIGPGRWGTGHPNATPVALGTPTPCHPGGGMGTPRRRSAGPRPLRITP